MFVYWLMFLLPALASTTAKVAAATRSGLTPGWLIYGGLLFILIGMRFQTGGDWNNYAAQYLDIAGVPLSDVLDLSDPGYKLLNWLSQQMDWGLVGVNTMAAAVFTFGLMSFCLKTPRPWLAVAVAVPYLIIVVAMGYTRQGMALGCAMLGLNALQQRSVLKFALWLLLGATFHRSAVLLLPIAALAATRNRFLVILWVGVVALVGYQAFLERDVDELYQNYIEREYQSQGALVRLAMNGIAAALFLRLGQRIRLPETSYVLWRWMSLLSLLLLAVYFVAPSSSTALDRLGLYMLPLQVVMFANLPDAMGRGNARRAGGWALAVLGFYAMVLFVWLNFANNAYMWRPYRFFLLEGWQ